MVARQAERLFLKALKQEPDNAEILGAYADYLVTKAGREEEASSYYRKAVNIDGGGPHLSNISNTRTKGAACVLAPDPEMDVNGTDIRLVQTNASYCRQQEQPGGLRQVPQVSRHIEHGIF